MSIEEPIDTFENNKEEMEKRKPKPFRYVDNKDEIENTLKMDKEVPFSVMKNREEIVSTSPENQVILSNIQNVGIIEGIIKKHEEIRKLEKK
jgi:hypothetical protein